MMGDLTQLKKTLNIGYTQAEHDALKAIESLEAKVRHLQSQLSQYSESGQDSEELNGIK